LGKKWFFMPGKEKGKLAGWRLKGLRIQKKNWGKFQRVKRLQFWGNKKSQTTPAQEKEGSGQDHDQGTERVKRPSTCSQKKGKVLAAVF